MRAIGAVFVLLLAGRAAATPPAVSPAVVDAHGIRIHELESPFQEGKTQIRVLRPEPLDSNRRYPAIYVLPVEAGNESRFGDGLLEVKKHDLANKHHVIFIAPTFFDLPWYADHATDSRVHQEAYFLNVVVPFIERTYPVEVKPDGRLLVGFSKSGWGAWSLLLRHPDLFSRAAAWDAPMMMEYPIYGSAEIFGTQENFENYRITEALRAKAASLAGTKRLILTGYDVFRKDHEQVHSLMNELKIPHEYRDGPQRKHDWHSGWLPEAVELLAETPQNRSR